jgi:hypothetical protein
MQNLRPVFLFASLALSLAAGFGSTPAIGTTIDAYAQLAGIRDFQVFVRAESKGNQTLRNMRDTEYLLSNSVVDTLRAGGLRYEEASPLSLSFTVEYSYNPTETDWVAISVRLELFERVKLERKTKTSASSHTHSVASWTWSEVDLVPVTRAESTMVARAKGFTQKFVDEVKLATRQYRPR